MVSNQEGRRPSIPRRPSLPVPQSPRPGSRRPSSNAPLSPNTVKFPDFLDELDEPDDVAALSQTSRDPSPAAPHHSNGNATGSGSTSKNKRVPFKRQDTWSAWKNKTMRMVRPNRQKSLSEAIHTVRNRKASISENAHEIAEALKAPVSFRLVVLCLVWFAMSILANASSKAILTALNRPVTLTIMQFLLATILCLSLSWIAKRYPSVRNAMPILKNGIRKPSRELIVTTLPLTAFQIGGHILNSDAMARIPVALVHTIKGLSPLMTVFAYRTFFDFEYTRSTYLSLIPLTLGVFMACSASFHGNVAGLLYAFGSTVLFVTQNIVSKKIFTDAAKAEADAVPLSRRKPDKLNLLCYSSALACLFTFPIWLWSEGVPMAAEYWDDGSIELASRPDALDHGALAVEFIFNGTFFFGQSLVAFILLGLVSPVTYSVASLIKRVAVIIFAIVWFGNPMTANQALGFILTFLGLYLYDRTADADRVDKRERQKVEGAKPLLPLNTADAKWRDLPVLTETPAREDTDRQFVGGSGYVNGGPLASGPGRPGIPAFNANGVLISLPHDTRPEHQSDAMGSQAMSVR